MHRFTAAALAVALAIFAQPAAHAHEVKAGSLVIGHPWSRQSPAFTDAAAGFLTIDNTGNGDDRLIKATAEIAPTVQLHDMKMEGEVMKMVELPGGIPLPAGKVTELKPKSLHIMFMGLKALPKAGTSFTATLVFEKAGSVAVAFEVMAPDAGMN